MLVDGKAIAADIYKELQNEISHLDVAPHLTIFTCQPDFASQKYLALKKKKAEAVGVQINIVEFPDAITTDEMVATIERSFMQTDGVIVQLPLPKHIDTEKVLACIPRELDVDAINFDGTDLRVLPPVVGAIDEIARRYDVLLPTSNILVVGEGKLVGKPAKIWAEHHGWHVETMNELTPHPERLISTADVLILGAGQAHFIKPEQVQEGVVIFDAGTSEDGGALAGDADIACQDKASLMTPVPGGIGPITLAILLRNLVTLHKRV